MTTVRLSACLVAMTALSFALTGCASPAPAPVETMGSGGETSSDASDSANPGVEAPDDGGSAIDRATADGMPALGLTECPQLDEYEYSPTAGNTVWHFSFTCTNRDAFDATTAALVGDGYELTPLVISEGSNVSERNHLMADANGGSTEVQLNLVGTPDELEYEIYVTLTLP